MATINVKDLAETLETTPRTARKFLRAVTPDEVHPGKGGRWNIEKRDIRGLKKKFEDFQVEHMRPHTDDVSTED